MKKVPFGSRGEGWVLAQLVIFVLFALAPQLGPDWMAPAFYEWLGILVMVAGAVTLGLSVVQLGSSLTPFPRPLPNGDLVTGGIYQLVRHPIYLGVLLAALGMALWSMSPLRLLLTFTLAAFFDRKASREEIWLTERFPDYVAYRALTNKLIPWIY